MIRIDAMWLAVEPIDMRSGPERLLMSVVHVFGSAQAHHGYVFAMHGARASSCWCTTAWVFGAPPGD